LEFVSKYLEIDQGELENEKREEYWQLIEIIFSELEAIQPLENLRNHQQRVNYVLCVEAAVIGFTFEEVIRKRDTLVEIGFKFDTLVVDDAH